MRNSDKPFTEAAALVLSVVALVSAARHCISPRSESLAALMARPARFNALIPAVGLPQTTHWPARRVASMASRIDQSAASSPQSVDRANSLCFLSSAFCASCAPGAVFLGARSCGMLHLPAHQQVVAYPVWIAGLGFHRHPVRDDVVAGRAQLQDSCRAVVHVQMPVALEGAEHETALQEFQHAAALALGIEAGEQVPHLDQRRHLVWGNGVAHAATSLPSACRNRCASLARTRVQRLPMRISSSSPAFSLA